MKNTFTLITLLLTLSIYAQSRILDTKIVMENNDTINTKIKVSVNLFNKSMLVEPSFTKKITLIDANGKKKKIKATSIKEISFTDFQGQDRRFVKYDKDKYLKEILFDGKIKWYRMFYYSLNSVLVSSDFLVDAQGNVSKVGAIGWKKKFKAMIASKPSLGHVEVTPYTIMALLNGFEED